MFARAVHGCSRKAIALVVLLRFVHVCWWRCLLLLHGNDMPHGMLVSKSLVLFLLVVLGVRRGMHADRLYTGTSGLIHVCLLAARSLRLF
jgi:hypothetical protein